MVPKAWLKACAEGARRRRPERENGLFLPDRGTASTIWTAEPLPTIWTEPLPFGLNGAFGGRLRRSEPSPARRVPSAQ